MNRLSLLKEAITNTPITVQTLKTLQLTKEDGIATIWFNSPQTLNAVSIRMTEQFKFLLTTLDQDTTIKVILIRSKHKKAFCVGADVKDFVLTYPDNKYNEVRTLHFGKTFRSVRKPIVSVVEGAALGGGFEISLLSDIVLCNEKATFGLPQINLGIIPALGGTQMLPRIVGNKVAMRLILTGQTISAAEAQRLNIVHILPTQNFEQKVKDFANNLANKALDTLEAGKKAVKLAVETTLEQGLQHEMTIFQALFNKKGPKEGIAAFVQKRKPNFRNI